MRRAAPSRLGAPGGPPAPAVGKDVRQAHAKVAARPYRFILLAALAVFLVWQVLTRSFVAYLADSAPEQALTLRGTNATALLNVAEKKALQEDGFEKVPTVLTPLPGTTSVRRSERAKGDDSSQPAQPADVPPPAAPAPSPASKALGTEIRDLAEAAVFADPLNARAFRLLGQVSDSEGDQERTKALMQAAAQRSMLESVAVYWLIRKSYADQEYAAAARYADILFRTRPHSLPYVMPLLGRLFETPEAYGDLVKLLAADVPWRPQALAYLPQSISDPRTPLAVLLSLKDSPHPPTTPELRPYVEFLVANKSYELGYYTWLQFLSPDQLATAGNLFNGNFDSEPTGMPFDWILPKSSGVFSKVRPRTDDAGNHALYISFGPGRVDYKEITQILMLSPGSYKFRGKQSSELVGLRGLEWQVACADQTDPLGKSDPIKEATSGWAGFEFSFTVPEEGCVAQTLRLSFDARSASEKFISGSIWYDDLQIERVTAVDANSTP